jgi:hypothetical protein
VDTSFIRQQAAAHLSLCFILRGSPAVLDLAPVKALNLRMSVTTGRRSESVLRAAARVVATGEPSRAMSAAARPQQEEVVVAASQVMVPHDPHQGRGWAHTGSRSAGGREVVEAPVGGGSAPKRGQSRGPSGPALERTPEVLVMRSDDCMMSVSGARRRGVDVPRHAARARRHRLSAGAGVASPRGT